MGLLDYNTSDGRFLFMLPWEGHTLVGTTDTKGPVRDVIDFADQNKNDRQERNASFLR